jgi:hypothetical protein
MIAADLKALRGLKNTVEIAAGPGYLDRGARR